MTLPPERGGPAAAPGRGPAPTNAPSAARSSGARSSSARSSDGRERAGLIVFGILEILVGAFLGTSVLALALLSVGGGGAPGMDALAGSTGLAGGKLGTFAALYAGLTGLFVYLGVGSFLPRRWVRPLVLYVATLWILGGFVLLALVAGIAATGGLPGAAADPDAGSSPGALGALGSPAVAVLLGGVLVVLYIVLPAALFLFHRRPALKEALERLDPVPRWTDRCPAPVLSLVLSLAISALFCLPFVRGPVPLFGWTLTGAPAAIVTLIAAAAFAALAVATYRLSPAGWWGSLAAVVVLTIVSVDMSFRFDVSALAADFSIAAAAEPGVAAAAGSPAAAAAAASTAVTNASGWLLGAGSLLFGIVCLIALLRLRRYFIEAPQAHEWV